MKVRDLPLKEAKFVDVSCTFAEAVKLVKESGFDQFPVKDGEEIVGVLTDKNLLARLAK